MSYKEYKLKSYRSLIIQYKLKSYRSLFYNEDDNLTFTISTNHRIITKNYIPGFSKIYRYSEIHRPEIKK